MVHENLYYNVVAIQKELMSIASLIKEMTENNISDSFYILC
jgi:hypothetical protein